ncbi:MAG: hypothetical protein IJP03_05190, partial [Christensenellaceae bacterium]|nr:hypothetical protein [Christensenellaceae bacterium]
PLYRYHRGARPRQHTGLRLYAHRLNPAITRPQQAFRLPVFFLPAFSAWPAAADDIAMADVLLHFIH